MTVKDLMNRRVISCSKNDTLFTVIAKIKKNKIYSVPVIDKNKKVLGLISYLRLLYDVKSPFGKMKASKIMLKPPKIKENTSIKDALDMMVNAGIDVIPVTKNGQIEAVISDYDLLNAFRKHDAIKKLTAGDVLQRGVYIKQDKSVASARTMMRDNRVDLIPIVDANKKFIGTASAINLLTKYMSFPKIKERRGEVVGKSIAIFSTPVSIILEKDIKPVRKNTKIPKVIETMFELGVKTLPVLEDSKIVGVVSRKLILKYLRDKIIRKGIKVKITGDLSEEEFSGIKTILEFHTKKFLYFAHGVKEVALHIRKAKGKQFYEIHLSIRKPGRGIYIKKEGRTELKFLLHDAIHRANSALRRDYPKKDYIKHG